jgi:hypothetical protein
MVHLKDRLLRGMQGMFSRKRRALFNRNIWKLSATYVKIKGSVVVINILSLSQAFCIFSENKKSTVSHKHQSSFPAIWKTINIIAGAPH